MKTTIILTLCLLTLTASAQRASITISNNASMKLVEQHAEFFNSNAGLVAGALTNLNRGIVFVDAASGNDTTGARENSALPFATIGAATAAAAQGDTVFVFPGTHQEHIIAETNVAYYFAEGVVLTNVVSNPIFTATNGPLVVRGSGVLSANADGTGHIVMNHHSVDMECLSMAAGYAFVLPPEFEASEGFVRLKAESITGGGYLSGDTNVVIDARTFVGIPSSNGDMSFIDCDVTFTTSGFFVGDPLFNGGSLDMTAVTISSSTFHFLGTEMTEAIFADLVSQSVPMQGTFYIE